MYEIPEHMRNESVWDTHTHLDTSENVAARDAWDILHYFWFQRELVAAGYPAQAERLPVKERTDRFIEAFEISCNTYWNQIVRSMLKDLFDIQIKTPADISALDERLSETSADPEWPNTVCDAIGIERIVVGTDSMDVSSAFAQRLFVVPHYHFSMAEGYKEMINAAGDEGIDGELAEGIGEIVRADVQRLAADGYRVIRADLEPFIGTQNAYEPQTGLGYRMNSRIDVDTYLGHVMLDAFNEGKVRLQVFTGMKRDWKIHTMINDPGRIVHLYPLFDQYGEIVFEFVNAADSSNFDIVQAARVFPNVCPGGLWWFNFRASTYRAVFQQRFEALPSSRASVVASDARCIEWSYGKVLLIKRLLSEFLDGQIASGWTDRSTAGRAARDWLYETARTGYTAL